MAKSSIIINGADNIAVALVDLKKGEEHEGVVLLEDITKGHKFALRDIPAGDQVIKYGSSIASAVRDIKQANTCTYTTSAPIFQKISNTHIISRTAL